MVLGITSETLKNVLKLRTPMLRDCFTSKYITAQIFDDAGGWHCVPLVQEYMHDDHIFVRLGKKVLLLKIDMAAIHTYRQKTSRPIQTLLYSTQDYMPFIPGDEKYIQKFCKVNGITKLGPIQAMFIHAASMLEERDEKGELMRESIKMSDIVEFLTSTLNPDTEQFATERAKLESAAEDMGTTDVLTPTKPMADILDKKMHNNPEALFQGYLSLKNVNWEWKKIANPARTPFGHWALVLVFMGLIVMVALGAYAYDAGLLTSGTGVSALDELLEKSREFTDPDAYRDSLDGTDGDSSTTTVEEEFNKITEEAGKAKEVPAETVIVTEKIEETPKVTEEIVTESPVVTEEIVTESPVVTEEIVTESPKVTEEIVTETPVVEGAVDIPETAKTPTDEKTIVEIPIVPKANVTDIIQFFNPDGWSVSSSDGVEITGAGTLLESDDIADDLTDLGRTFPDYSMAHDTPDEITYTTQGNDTENTHEVKTNNEELNEILKKESIVEGHYHDNFNPESGMFDKEIVDDADNDQGEFIQDFN